MKTFNLKCPKCGDESDIPMLDFDSGKFVSSFIPDDFTMCPKCLTLCTFEVDGTLHETTESEVAGMPLEFWAAITEARVLYQAKGVSTVPQVKSECPTCFNEMLGVNVGLRSTGNFEVGKVGMCMHCGSWLTVDDDKVNLRWASEEEVASIPEHIQHLSAMVSHRTKRYY